jgi:aryl-alcohol dehydrogenase-like predicted oxidoreductase
VFVASKVPPKNRKWPARAGIGIDEVFPYDYIVECTNESLRNLKMETLDLQQLHVWNPEWIGRDEWRRAAEDLKKAGKVRYFGLSLNNHEPDSALEVIKTGLIDAVQVIHNIYDQTPERSLYPLCIERGVGVLARVPLDEGALTGTINESSTWPKDDFRSWYFRDAGRKREVARRFDALQKDLAGVAGTVPEIALRYCLSAPAVSTVIPGMRRVSTVESSCGVSKAGPLSPEVMAILRRHAWDKNYYD